MKLLDDIRALLRGREADPWIGYNPDAEVVETTEEDILKAVEQIARPHRPRYLIIVLQILTLVWIIAHFAILYTMIGSPIQGGIFAYIIVDLLFIIHYYILLNQRRKQR